jgi:predicted transcriptional regulator
MKHRSRIDIMCQILEIAKGDRNGGIGVTQTRIMYRAFLTFVQVREFLTFLTERGLLQFDRNTKMFKTTEKGFGLLQKFKQLEQVLEG